MNIKKILIILFVLVIIAFPIYKYGRSFWHPYYIKMKGIETIESRVKALKDDVTNRLLPNIEKLGLKNFPNEISFLAFKDEQIFEVYVNIENDWKLLKQYNFTNISGELGPKLKEGDRQIPEGIYKIEYLNPNSTYYLSLKVSYPNEFDKKHANQDGRSNLGGDIFIHGNNLTVGCIPLGDEAIEEIFLLAHYAFNNDIKVIISPKDFRVTSNIPNIKSIDWEKELYLYLTKALTKYN